MGKMTRRDFLIKGATALAAIELGRSMDWLPDMVSPVQAASQPKVVAATGTSEDSAETILRSALDGLGGIGRFVKPGQTVVIKPNATWAYAPKTASSSDPDLLIALIKMVQEAGASRVIVMDHCSIEPGTAECLRKNLIGKAVETAGVESLFPDRFNGPKDLFTKIELPNGKAFQKMGIIKAAAEADVRINLGLAKTHSVTRMTMALKHMMGFLENPASLHANLYQGIADLNTASAMQAQLHILEALLVRVPYGDYRVCAGPETEQSHPHIIKRYNQIVAGVDPVLIDAYGCVNYYQIKPKELAYVKLAAENGVGDLDLEEALQDGRMLDIKVGEIVQTTPEPSATATVMVSAAQASATPTGPAQTQTPLPTAAAVAEVPAMQEAAAVSGGAAVNCEEVVVNPNRFLSGALIPAAAVVAGLGAVLLRRLGKGQEEDAKETADDRHDPE